MFISLEYRYAFVHIPKTAGEWLYKMFSKCAWKDQTPSVEFWGQDHVRHMDITHVHQDVLYDYVGKVLYDECVSFCVVRNPYNRFYSAFGDIPSKVEYSTHVAQKRNADNQCFWTHKYPVYADPKKTDDTDRRQELFEVFCGVVDTHHIPNDTITKHNIHLIPQHKFVYYCNGHDHDSTTHETQLVKNVTNVLRFESLQQDLVNMFNQNNFPHSKRPRKRYPGSHEIRFDTLKPFKLTQSYIDRYSPKSIALVNKYYKKDFELFGFEMLDPVAFTAVRRPIGHSCSSRTNILTTYKPTTRKQKRRRRHHVTNKTK